MAPLQDAAETAKHKNARTVLERVISPIAATTVVMGTNSMSSSS
jgi:hypothetical protein